MAEDTPMKEPTEATEQLQHTSAADTELGNATASHEKPVGKEFEDRMLCLPLKLLLNVGSRAVDPVSVRPKCANLAFVLQEAPMLSTTRRKLRPSPRNPPHLARRLRLKMRVRVTMYPRTLKLQPRRRMGPLPRPRSPPRTVAARAV